VGGEFRALIVAALLPYDLLIQHYYTINGYIVNSISQERAAIQIAIYTGQYRR